MPRIEVFSDFDGTISMADTGCILIDSGMGYENRKKMDGMILRHEMSFLEGMELWWGSVNLTHEEGLDLLRDEKLDPGFVHFYQYVKSQEIPFSIVSCGLDIIIKDFMGWHLGKDEAEKLVILSNHGEVVGRQWKVTYYDDSPHSHDKAVCIRDSKAAFKKAVVEEQREREEAGEMALQKQEEHVVVFCGDGISDLSAAREADVLFARNGRDLEKYCKMHKIPFLGFDTFDEVTAVVQGLKEGTLTIDLVNERQKATCETP
ncbi:HAD-like domain-containing protein [Linnemannia elongata]|nr:HAD-like domain-containing protein [Linnemannia elongata]